MPVLVVLGFLGTVVGLVRALPQLIRLLRTRDVAGVSLEGCLTSSVVSAAWALYGVLTDQFAVVLASATPSIVFVFTAVAAVRYGRSVREIRTAPVFLAIFAGVAVAAGATGLGLALTVGALVANTPHLLAAVREKDLSGVSPSTWALTTTDGSIWVTYALITGDIPILINNLFQVSTSGLILARRWSWQRAEERAALTHLSPPSPPPPPPPPPPPGFERPVAPAAPEMR